MFRYLTLLVFEQVTYLRTVKLAACWTLDIRISNVPNQKSSCEAMNAFLLGVNCVFYIPMLNQNCRLRHLIWSLQWRHNGLDGVSNHQPHYCLLNRLFRRRLMKTSKLRVTGLCEDRWPVNSPHKGPVTRKMFPFDDVIIGTEYSNIKYLSDKLYATDFPSMYDTKHRFANISNVKSVLPWYVYMRQ